MGNKDLQAIYVDQLNYILPTVNLLNLDISCNSTENTYAKEILKQMHDILIDVYGTDSLGSSYGLVELPAVIQGRNTGHIGLGIVTLDLESSGEHWGTFFLTPKGIIDQNGKKLKPAESKYLSNMYIPYNYWYTASVERDHHVDFKNVPTQIAEMLNACHSNQPELKLE